MGDRRNGTPEPVMMGLPAPVVEGSRPFRRRRSDRGWRHWLGVAAKVAPVVVALATIGWHYQRTRAEEAEWKGYVRASLESLKEAVKRLDERTHQ